jgi:hypothetical protein
MEALFKCDICHYERSLPEEYRDQKLRCPQCASIILVGAEQPRNLKSCPFCAELILEQARKCRFCNEIIDRALAIAKDKQKIREVQRASQILDRYLPGSRPSLIMGILSLILFPLSYLFGPVSILMGFHAFRESKKNPHLEGVRFAKAGIVLGTVSMIALSLILVLNYKIQS